MQNQDAAAGPAAVDAAEAPAALATPAAATADTTQQDSKLCGMDCSTDRVGKKTAAAVDACLKLL